MRFTLVFMNTIFGQSKRYDPLKPAKFTGMIEVLSLSFQISFFYQATNIFFFFFFRFFFSFFIYSLGIRLLHQAKGPSFENIIWHPFSADQP